MLEDKYFEYILVYFKSNLAMHEKVVGICPRIEGKMLSA